MHLVHHTAPRLHHKPLAFQEQRLVLPGEENNGKNSNRPHSSFPFGPSYFPQTWSAFSNTRQGVVVEVDEALNAMIPLIWNPTFEGLTNIYNVPFASEQNHS